MLSKNQQNDELPFINMTPMVDVILCLLVFFMAATRLYDWDESEFKVSVPEVAEAAPLTAAPDDLVLTVVRPGAVAVGETTYDLDGLATLLAEAHARYVNQGVMIRGEASLAYQDLADVLSVCDAAGNPQRPPSRPHPRSRRQRSSPNSLARSDCSRLDSLLDGQDVQPTVPTPRSQLMELISQLYQTLRHLSPDSVNALAHTGRPLALRDPLRDHLRRDGAGRDAVPAG